MNSATNSSNLFIPHYDLSHYEINKHGIIRLCDNKKVVVCGSNGRVQLNSGEGGYLHRLVHKEVQKTFYPQLGNKRGAMTYDETYGWMPNDNMSIEAKLKKLMSGDVCMSIKARKMANDNINFNYVGFVDDDEPVCLVYNEDEDKTTLYHTTIQGEHAVEYGDVLYHLKGNERTNGGKYDTSILENLIMAKYYYLKYKAEEYDVEVKDRMYKKYYDFDFEEKFDDWCDKLEAHQAEKVGKIPQGFKQVKEVNRVAKMLGQQQFTEEERAEYNEEKDRGEKLKRLRQQEQEHDFLKQKDNYIKNETAKADKIMYAIQNDKPFFKRFAEKNNAPSVHDFNSCVEWCRSSSKIYRQKRDQSARQEEKKSKSKAERRAELQKELSLLND